MGIRTIFRLWLPLAVSFELMMLEGPTVQAAMGWLPDTGRNLAAFGLTFSICLVIESPVIMLLSTAIALVRDRQSYYALQRFVLGICYGCTALSALVGFTPLFSFISERVMGQPAPIVEAARPAIQIMLLWTAAIAWRRFYQGILIRHKQTAKVSTGTAIRLVVTILTALVLAKWSSFSGVVVAACATMAAVLAEAIATTWFALPVVRREVLSVTSSEPPLTQRAIFAFHTPLAATTLLTLLAQPITSTALARLPDPKVTLAAWPVAYMTLLVIRGWGLALQEITVAQAESNPASRPALRRFTWLVGIVTTAFTLLLVLTPLHTIYMSRLLHLEPDLQKYAHLGVTVGALMPLLTALGSWARGLLVARGETRVVYWGMAVNLSVHGGLLALGALWQLPGMWVAALAFTLASGVEILFLSRRYARHASV
jgi:hypothetical protein